MPKRLTDILERKKQQGKSTYSLELVPGMRKFDIDEVLRQLDSSGIGLDFISLTMRLHNASGDLNPAQDISVQAINALEREGYNTVLHLTCWPYTIRQIDQVVDAAQTPNILAIRGDVDESTLAAAISDGTHYANAGELTDRLVELGRDVSVASFPEGYPHEMDAYTSEECVNNAARYLGEKAERGARVSLTQMCYQPETYESFVRQVRRQGQEIPIIPGFKPLVGNGVRNAYEQCKFVENAPFFRSSVPDEFKETLFWLGKEEAREAGIELSGRLGSDFIQSGAPGVHLYVLTDIDAGAKVIERIKYNAHERRQKTEGIAA